MLTRLLDWPRAVARGALDGFARRLAARLPMAPPPALQQPAPPPQADPFGGLGAHILGQQTMFVHHGLDRLNRSLLLQGRIAAQGLRDRGRLRTLADAEFRVSSQWGEDGIIEWLCQRLPSIPRSFVEFGVESYAEANTRFLLENRGWRGLILDGNSAAMQTLREDPLYWRQDLTAVGAFITRENIRDLIVAHGFHEDLGILSIDIDGNDYWVLEALAEIRAAILICEINGVFGDLRRVTVPYRPDFQRLEAHYSGQYFGCSVRAAMTLASQQGYEFIGTNSNGVNAFFVRRDLAEPVLDALEEVRIWPPRHRDSRDVDGRLDFTRGMQRLALVAHLPVVDLETERVVALGELEPLYSPAFIQEFR